MEARAQTITFLMMQLICKKIRNGREGSGSGHTSPWPVKIKPWLPFHGSLRSVPLAHVCASRSLTLPHRSRFPGLFDSYFLVGTVPHYRAQTCQGSYMAGSQDCRKLALL